MAKSLFVIKYCMQLFDRRKGILYWRKDWLRTICAVIQIVCVFRKKFKTANRKKNGKKMFRIHVIFLLLDPVAAGRARCNFSFPGDFSEVYDRYSRSNRRATAMSFSCCCCFYHHNKD
jgi:hypothetical protein